MSAATSGPPAAELAAVAAAHARLLTTVAGLDDESARRPSGLPDWNRAEVVTHLARNADSFRYLTEARLRGEIVEQYPGGRPARAAAIAAGRDRPAAELQADLSRSVEWLHDTWSAMPDEEWDLEVSPDPTTTRTLAGLVTSRWREVEIHHVDLALAYTPEQWPPELVAGFLPTFVEDMNRRSAASGDAGPPDGAWAVWADDLETAWVLRTVAGHVVVTPLGEDLPDAIVRGPAHAVLAWLLGRRSPELAGLSLAGDDRVRQLPAWFPFT